MVTGSSSNLNTPDVPPVAKNTTPQAIVTKSNFQGSKLRKFLSSLKFKLSVLKDFIYDNWINLPKKQRIVIASVSGFLIVALSMLTIALVKNGGEALKRYGPRKFEMEIANFGDWKKLVIPQRQKPFFTLAASTTSKYGILPNENFILKTESPIGVNFIKNNIASSTPVNIVSLSNNEFKITPQKNLGLEEVITLSLGVKDKSVNTFNFDRDYSWVYQTQGKFRVVSSIPGDKKSQVPINTGVEIVFNQDNFNDPTPYLSIFPEFKFRTEIHAERFVIVPLDPLMEKTIYTVNLSKGLNLKYRNDPIAEDYSFTFQTKEKDITTHPPFFRISEDFQQISPSERFITKVETANWKSENTVNTEVYKFPTVETFIASRRKVDDSSGKWTTYYSENNAVDTSQLEKAMTADLKVESKDDIDYLQLPDALAEGLYVIQFRSTDNKRLEQLWLQSTTVTGFVSVGKEQTVVWANNIDGEPVPNASIALSGSTSEYRTYDNGTTVFTTPTTMFDESGHYITITDTDSNRVIIPVNNLSGNAPPGKLTPNDYISYLYNERYLYKPGDTLYFFGVIKDRSTNLVPANVTVKLKKSSSSLGAEFTKSINPGSDGSFLDNLKLDNIPTGWYDLELQVNDITLESTGFSVTEYEKPEMKIEVMADKKAIFTSESVNFTAVATFFDGTPATSIPITIRETKTQKTTSMTTGEAGEVIYTYQPKYSNSEYYPRYETVNFSLGTAQESKIEGFGSISVFGSRLMIDSDSDQDGNKAKLKATVFNVDLNKINSSESSEYQGSPTQNKEASLTINKTWYEKKETGTYYDFIEKVTRKTYQYIRHQDTVENKKLTTDTHGEISYEFQLEEGKSFTAILEVSDQDGHPAKTSEYYYLSASDSETKGKEIDSPQLNLDKDNGSFSLDEEVKLNIILGESEYPDNDKNRFLFILANRGRQEITLSDNPRYSFTYREDYIPNIFVGAYIFTGKYYTQVSTPCREVSYCSYYNYYGRENNFNGLQITYKIDDSKLSLTINPDKENYQPGNSAKISVKVEKNSVPIQDASVNLVLVDEALAAMDAVRTPSILTSLYNKVEDLIYYNYATHEPVITNESGAEMGGGGGGDRDIFKDAVFFGLNQEVTDENGVAVFIFTLPDNITTWVTYAQALTNKIEAGQTEGKVIVTKDFFVTSQFPKQFLIKDKPELTGGSFGKNLSKDSTVDFKAIFYKDNQEIQSSSKSTQAFKSINFTFPSINTGSYSASLRGKAGDMEDGIRLPFNVISSRLNLEYFKKYELEKGQTMSKVDMEDVKEDKPIKLVINDLGKGIYYSQLTRFCRSGSNRLEKQIAKSSASKILVDKFDDEKCKVDSSILEDFQYYNGGLSQVKWGGSDLPTTAWAIFVDSEPYNKNDMIKFFESLSNQSQGGNLQKIYASWGLTSLGKPKITDLQSLAQSALTYEEKVTLALALTTAGDTARARDLYYDLLADYAYEYSPYIRIQAELKGKSQIDSYIENTARALLLGSLVDKTYDQSMQNYISDFKTSTQDVVIDLATIAFVKDQLDKLPDENTKFAFHSPTQNIEKDLIKGRNTTLNLTPADLKNFNLSVLEGKAEANFDYYIGTSGVAKLHTDNLLKIKRRYRKISKASGNMKVGEIVEVRIDFNLDFDKSPTGCYTITDHLPSGLKYISNPGVYGLTTEGFVSEKENNVIEGYFCNSPWWQKYGSKYLNYFARASSVGNYIAEPAIMQSDNYLSNFQTTPEEIMTIEGTNL